MKETLHFLEYKKNVDKEQEQAEQEVDILTEAMRNEKHNEYLKNRSYFNQQRDEFNKVMFAKGRIIFLLFLNIFCFISEHLRRALETDNGSKTTIATRKKPKN